MSNKNNTIPAGSGISTGSDIIASDGTVIGDETVVDSQIIGSDDVGTLDSVIDPADDGVTGDGVANVNADDGSATADNQPRPPESPAIIPDDGSPDNEKLEVVQADEPVQAKVIRLNNSLPFDTIFGIYHGAKFFQNGEYFDSGENHLPKLSMNGVDEDTLNGPKGVAPDVAKANPNPVHDGVDLKAWSEGKAQYMWPHIATAVKSATDIRPANKNHALALLKEHGVISNGNELDESNG